MPFSARGVPCRPPKCAGMLCLGAQARRGEHVQVVILEDGDGERVSGARHRMSYVDMPCVEGGRRVSSSRGVPSKIASRPGLPASTVRTVTTGSGSDISNG